MYLCIQKSSAFAPDTVDMIYWCSVVHNLIFPSSETKTHKKLLVQNFPR